ncbi:hypothetical protein LSH36_956g00018, partial [Paralvinella palmiformis]
DQDAETKQAIVRQCPEPDKVKGATAHYKNTFIDSVVTYVTNYGYRFQYGEKARTIICLPNGKWNAKMPDAITNSCPPIDVKGSTKSTKQTIPGTKVEIKCITPHAKMENGLSMITIVCSSS